MSQSSGMIYLIYLVLSWGSSSTCCYYQWQHMQLTNYIELSIVFVWFLNFAMFSLSFFFPNLEDQGMDPNTKGRPHRDGPFAKDTQEKTEQPLSTWPADMSKKATDQQRQDRYVFLSQRYFFNSKPSIGPTAFPWHQSFGLGRISSWEKEIGEGRGGMDLICINYFRALLEFWLGITNHGNIHHNVSIQSV